MAGHFLESDQIRYDISCVAAVVSAAPAGLVEVGSILFAIGRFIT